MVWLRRLLMRMGVLRPAGPEPSPVPEAITAATRVQTAQNTRETDRQIGQLIESAARQTARTERRAELSALHLSARLRQRAIESGELTEAVLRAMREDFR